MEERAEWKASSRRGKPETVNPKQQCCNGKQKDPTPSNLVAVKA